MNVRARLEEARRREKAQTLFYRALAAMAEEAGEVGAVDRLNDLHADEQHHLSRLTARLLELGSEPADLRSLARPGIPTLQGWEVAAREREAGEVSFYEDWLDETGLDPETREVIAEILVSERHHREHLAGKWMSA